jgi:transposase
MGLHVAALDVTEEKFAGGAVPSDAVKGHRQREGSARTLRNFGLKVGMVGKVMFETRIKELVENLPDLALLVEPPLIVRRVLREQIIILHRRLLAIVRGDKVCRRLMTTPGVGPVVALTYRATVDVLARFRKSKSVGR